MVDLDVSDKFPGTRFEYEPGKHITIKTISLGCNTKIVIYKPGIYKHYGRYANCPIVTIGMNGTGFASQNKFLEMQNMIGHAVSILNQESVGRINTSEINCMEMGLSNEQAVYEVRAVRNLPRISSKEIVLGRIYAESNGRKTIYLGNSLVYELDGINENMYRQRNRSNDGIHFSTLIYGSDKLARLLSRSDRLSKVHLQNGDILYKFDMGDKSNIGEDFDSYASKRKFVELVGETLIPSNTKFIMLEYINSKTLIVVRDTKSDIVKAPHFLDKNSLNNAEALNKLKKY